MKLFLEDQLTSLIMAAEKVPLVIVEGADDVAIYERIAKEAGKSDLIFRPIEHFEGYTEGCLAVIKAINDSQSFFYDTENAERLFVGIIDADSRRFRSLQPNEIDINQLKGIFVLKHYSIETYFATRTNLSRFIEYSSSLSEKEITTQVLDFVEKMHIGDLSELYYISLECLQKACNQHYQAVVTYAGKQVKEDKHRKRLMTLLAAKIPNLDSFALQKGLTINDIRGFCKGKFYLYSFAYKAYQQIQNLSPNCGISTIPKCDNCLRIAKNCKYKLKTTLQYDAVYEHFLTLVDKDECADIIQKFQALA